MPRKARIDAPGALHHVIVRGIERKAIFKDNVDRDAFLERAGSIFTDSETPCFAWALMTNIEKAQDFWSDYKTRKRKKKS